MIRSGAIIAIVAVVAGTVLRCRNSIRAPSEATEGGALEAAAKYLGGRNQSHVPLNKDSIPRYARVC
jgi:hypothetical protein